MILNNYFKIKTSLNQNNFLYISIDFFKNIYVYFIKIILF